MSTPETTHTTEPTRISVHPGATRVRVGLVTGALAPRLIERDTTTARVALTAAQMLLLDGDAVHLEIDVGDGCTLEIEDVGGTVAYPGSSSWQVTARVGSAARLLWHGLPFVVTSDARASRETTFVLGRDAAVLFRETLVLGRHGETGGAIDSSLTAMDDSGPVLVERLMADAAFPEPGVLGAHRVLDSVIAVGFRPPSASGDLVMEQPGAVSRFLGHESHASRLDGVWTGWRAALLQEVLAAEPARTPATSAV